MNQYLHNFESLHIALEDDIHIHAKSAGSGPALLMLHGHPETHLMWHKIAPQLAKNYTVVLPDLRGYGDSAHPKGLPDHSNYSRRVMANDMIAVMEKLGFTEFYLVGHDRGARVAHRMLLDHPTRVKKCMFLDIAPTYDMYKGTNMSFGLSHYHWFFLVQPTPLPERLLAGDPEYFFRTMYGDYSDIENSLRVFPEEIKQAYIEKLSTPQGLHAICEDYRACATIDLVHDEADRDQKTDVPLMVLWGEKGNLNKEFDVLKLWQGRGNNVQGYGITNCGHFIPEDSPAATIEAIEAFMC